MRRVVVKSIGALTSLGKNLDEYWEGLKNGVSGSELINRFVSEDSPYEVAEIKNSFSTLISEI